MYSYSIVGGDFMPKSIKQKQKEYEEKYAGIPLDLEGRLNYMYDTMKIDDRTAQAILMERERRMNSLYYTQIKIVLYQEPQGAKRPRYRIINRSNVLSAAKLDPSFVHVYSPDAADNHNYMRRMITDDDFNKISHLICTPCDVEYRAYFPTPKDFNKVETFMAEIGLSRPLTKPDFDNIEKVYADMYNANIWIDDVLTIRGLIDKFYSILPRVEIDLKYLNAVYNKKQYNSIIKRKDYTPDMNLYYI